MEIVRNIQIKLNVPEDKHSVLDETPEQFRHAVQRRWPRMERKPLRNHGEKNTLHAPR